MSNFEIVNPNMVIQFTFETFLNTHTHRKMNDEIKLKLQTFTFESFIGRIPNLKNQTGAIYGRQRICSLCQRVQSPLFEYKFGCTSCGSRFIEWKNVPIKQFIIEDHHHIINQEPSGKSSVQFKQIFETNFKCFLEKDVISYIRSIEPALSLILSDYKLKCTDILKDRLIFELMQ